MINLSFIKTYINRKLEPKKALIYLDYLVNFSLNLILKEIKNCLFHFFQINGIIQDLKYC